MWSLEDKKLEGSLKANIVKELIGNKKLIEMGNGDSSSGSDGAPSEDNLKPEDIAKVVPISSKEKLSKFHPDKKNAKKKNLFQ